MSSNGYQSVVYLKKRFTTPIHFLEASTSEIFRSLIYFQYVYYRHQKIYVVTFNTRYKLLHPFTLFQPCLCIYFKYLHSLIFLVSQDSGQYTHSPMSSTIRTVQQTIFSEEVSLSQIAKSRSSQKTWVETRISKPINI